MTSASEDRPTPAVSVSNSGSADSHTLSCLKCRKDIPLNAELCTHCGSHQSRFRNAMKDIGIILGFLAALGTAIIHTISIWPQANRVLFPTIRLQVIAFQSNKRLVLSNHGDHDLYISHVHFESSGIDSAGIFRNLLAVAKDEDPGKITISLGTEMDAFDTNQIIENKLTAGGILSHPINSEHHEGLVFVHDLSTTEWKRIVLFAGVNKRSDCIRPIFFSPRDPRFLQLQRAHGTALNTFGASAYVAVYSPQRQESIQIPFEAVGTVVRANTGPCFDRIRRWINPRRGHPEDLE